MTHKITGPPAAAAPPDQRAATEAELREVLERMEALDECQVLSRDEMIEWARLDRRAHGLARRLREGRP